MALTAADVLLGRFSKKWKLPKYARFNFTQDQIKWLADYEEITGFEPMVDESDGGDADFDEIYFKNVSWYEDHTSQCLLDISTGTEHMLKDDD